MTTRSKDLLKKAELFEKKAQLAAPAKQSFAVKFNALMKQMNLPFSMKDVAPAPSNGLLFMEVFKSGNTSVSASQLGELVKEKLLPEFPEYAGLKPQITIAF